MGGAGECGRRFEKKTRRSPLASPFQSFNARREEVGCRLADAEAADSVLDQLIVDNAARHVGERQAAGVRLALSDVKGAGRLKLNLLVGRLL